MARPSTYNHETAERILEQLADGRLLREICDQDGFPPASTVATWVVADRAGFQDRYWRARAAGCVLMSEEILAIVDGVAGCESMAKVQAARSRADKRQWLLSRLMPARFSDRLQLESRTRTEVTIWLPAKVGPGDHARLVDGQAQEVDGDQLALGLEDGRER